jgi:hypothetical protein
MLDLRRGTAAIIVVKTMDGNMKSNYLKAALAAAIIAAFALSTVIAEEGATPTYIGSGKCKICHKGEKNGSIWEAFEASAHAKAMDKLIEKGEQNNPECLACHTTGYGKGGYSAEDTTKADFGHVGCEACHGPGSEYKSKKVMESREASLAAGLLIPDENTCKTCHNEKSPTFKGFDFAEYWAKIVHKLPEAAPDSAAAPAATEGGE